MYFGHGGGNLIATVEDTLGLGTAAEQGGGKGGGEKNGGNFHTVNGCILIVD